MALGVAATMLAGCSAFEPDYVACPSIKAVDGTGRVEVTGDPSGAPIQLRLNGVRGLCTVNSDGFDLVLQVGLFARRDLTANVKTDEYNIDITMAFLDSNDQVVGRHIHSASGFFAELEEKSRPTLKISTDIPAGTRVILGLGKLAEAQ